MYSIKLTIVSLVVKKVKNYLTISARNIKNVYFVRA